jgi:alanyl-tRNA synthetase
VYLDRTAFYPESGGQPTDRGSVAGIPLREAVDEGDEIAHVLEQAPASEAVQCALDWGRRFDHMQQHTGQHLLSGGFEKMGEYKTVSFHLGAETSTIDLDSDRLGRTQIEAAEDLANCVVFENRQVRIFFRPATETSQMDLRKPTFREGDVRLVEVENFDLSACGGTHVSQTGAVGIISVRRFERMKGVTRVEFVCGTRALRAARRDYLVLNEAAKQFSAALENVPELITKQAQELREAVRAQGKLVERLARYTAEELRQAGTEAEGLRVVHHIFSPAEAGEGKQVAHELAKHPSTIGLIGVKGKPAMLFFSQSPGGAMDMGNLLKQTVAKFGGKGGGTRDFAQGGGFDESRLEEALLYAMNLVKR